MEVTADLRVDVAVIGAGPAGSTLAALLASRGIAVAVIDRDVIPRDKLCGEFLSWDALPIVDLVGALPQLDVLGAPHITRCRVIAGSRPFEFEFPAAARGISRMALDDLLLARAEELGALRLDGWSAVRVEHSPDIQRLELQRGDAAARVEAAVLVGAWGRWGRIDRQLGRSFVSDRARRYFGFKRHYYPRSSRDEQVIDLHSFGRGYLGVSSVEGGLTNICGLAHASRLAGMKGGWEAFVSQIGHERQPLGALFASHTPAQDSFLSSEPVIFRAREPSCGGILMVGDAAGLIDPLTGSGMAMAMQSALLAAPFVLARLENSTRQKRIDRAYAREYRRFFAGRIGWSRRTAFFLSRPHLLEAALRAMSRPAIGRFLLDRTRASSADLVRLHERWSSPVRNL
ncbi:MAG TPA: NAD(P)/FAD-dependent oxidoreductase [Thermoanaerobaculia bacterium]|nr:NAD(P)/FAD-dependent oxidoreductase [Thermoanaerobaculia bacterium]